MICFHIHILKEIYNMATTVNQSFLETMTANMSVTKMPHITGRDNISYHNYKNVDEASTFFQYCEKSCVDTIMSSK
jgi:hypothetical protein